MAVFLHAGHGKSLRSRDIIGIFDIDLTTVSSVTRAFLTDAQKNKRVINTTDDIPKSFIISGKKNERESVVTISKLSSQTLHDRLKRKI